MIFPVHKIDHWALVVLDTRNKTVNYYDTLASEDPEVLQDFRKVLYESYPEVEFQFINHKDIPQQPDNDSCGPFKCNYAAMIIYHYLTGLQKYNILLQDKFNKNHIKAMRENQRKSLISRTIRATDVITNYKPERTLENAPYQALVKRKREEHQREQQKLENSSLNLKQKQEESGTAKERNKRIGLRLRAQSDLTTTVDLLDRHFNYTQQDSSNLACAPNQNAQKRKEDNAKRKAFEQISKRNAKTQDSITKNYIQLRRYLKARNKYKASSGEAEITNSDSRSPQPEQDNDAATEILTEKLRGEDKEKNHFEIGYQCLYSPCDYFVRACNKRRMNTHLNALNTRNKNGKTIILPPRCKARRVLDSQRSDGKWWKSKRPLKEILIRIENHADEDKSHEKDSS